MKIKIPGLKKYILLMLILQGCGSGGPLTPVEAFGLIKNAVDNKDSNAIVSYITRSSLEKINKHNQLVKELRADQISLLADKYGYPADRIKNLGNSDLVSMYFFSDTVNIKLGKYFCEKIISVDVDGNRAFIKTESGVELGFTREGPYWKFDLSSL